MKNMLRRSAIYNNIELSAERARHWFIKIVNVLSTLFIREIERFYFRKSDFLKEFLSEPIRLDAVIRLDVVPILRGVAAKTGQTPTSHV